MELEADARGIITFMPIAAWSVSLVQGKTVGLAIDYYASAEDAAAQRPTRVQLHADPAVAREIGRSLQERAGMVLGLGGPAPR